MKKIVVTGAGSAQSNGVINSILKAGGGEEILGLGCVPDDLVMCRAHKKYLMPHSRSPEYRDSLLSVLKRERPEMIHFQHDLELAMALRFRDEIEACGVGMLVPDYETIDTCVHKFKSWEKFKNAGIVVPENIVIRCRDDLRDAFERLANADGVIWLRAPARRDHTQNFSRFSRRQYCVHSLSAYCLRFDTACPYGS